MFEVRCESPMDDEWQNREKIIKSTARRSSDHAGAGFGKRDHGWYVLTIGEAVDLKNRLNEIPDVTAVIREK